MLAYGLEVMLSVEVALYNHRLTTFQEELNNATLREALNLLPSVRGTALLREALYQLHIARLYDRTVKLHHINIGDLILRHTKALARAGEHDKLTENWEGSYKVTASIQLGTYHVETLIGAPIARTWHSSNLRNTIISNFFFIQE